MRKCIVCKDRFEPVGNANQNKQLTCGKASCRRALKTIRQSLRREKVRKVVAIGRRKRKALKVAKAEMGKAVAQVRHSQERQEREGS